MLLCPYSTAANVEHISIMLEHRLAHGDGASPFLLFVEYDCGVCVLCKRRAVPLCCAGKRNVASYIIQVTTQVWH